LGDVAARDRFAVVAVAASAGETPAIGEVLSSLPKDLQAAVLIVQHLAHGLRERSTVLLKRSEKHQRRRK
jgi:chemotaxis response regulator CheB